MSSIKTYEDSEITLINFTKNPNTVIQLASDITQKNLSDELMLRPAKPALVKFLFESNHHSLFEHCDMTLLITGVSRSFLAQITRHRLASYTAASQHYQNYGGYDHVISSRSAEQRDFIDALELSDFYYTRFVKESGLPPEEARQILPNSKAVNILWTINARSLINFLNLRLCKRNVEEMYIFAKKLHNIAEHWWPELFELVGPDCKKFRACTQGKMQSPKCEGVPLWKGNV